ncbi:hypothetical protein V2J09_010891 [Rumex salicifolius]
MTLLRRLFHSHFPLPSSNSKSQFIISTSQSRQSPSPSKIKMLSSAPNSTTVHRLPEDQSGEIDAIAEQTFRRYSLVDPGLKRSSGIGVSIVWFRNDLRVLDNETLFRAWVSSQSVLPVYCVDPRLFGTTHFFDFPKTGALRAHFLIESLVDLKQNLRKHGLDLLITQGTPEEILPSLANAFGAHTVFTQKETCSEELGAERKVRNALTELNILPQGFNQRRSCKLELVWGTTLFHLEDLPFDAHNLPDVYTQFRKSVESTSNVRGCIKMPLSLGPTPEIEDWGTIPTLQQLVHDYDDEKVRKGSIFLGGESASLARIHDYFWKKDLLKSYKVTRNGMLGPDYSTKFSPWLANGCLSPRLIYEEVKRYEKERISNDSTYWVLFELIWRDYFRFLSVRYGNSIFQLETRVLISHLTTTKATPLLYSGGPRKQDKTWSRDKTLFECWRDGKTGYPLIDANMKELSTTGFMSNRGRQIVCSFLVRDMGIDWRMGAEWFETCLLDYDPCSNYGNWTYGAGVGNDPREDRYFSIPKQVYDADGEYVAFWLPELRHLPKAERHSPGNAYIKPVVDLKFKNTNKPITHNSASAMRQSDLRRRRRT